MPKLFSKALSLISKQAQDVAQSVAVSVERFLAQDPALSFQSVREQERKQVEGGKMKTICRTSISAFLVAAAIFWSTASASQQKPDNTPKPPECKTTDCKTADCKTADSKHEFDPATFIHVYEDTKGRNRITVYEPPNPPKCSGTRVSVDAESAIVIIPKPSGADLPFNKLYISAVLTSGDKKQNLEVAGYSEVGKDKATTSAQEAVAFRTAEDVEKMVLTMADVAGRIVHYAYEISDEVSLYSTKAKETISTQDKARTGTTDKEKADKGDQDPVGARARERFEFYKPEIQAIGNFFTDKDNLAMVQILGNKVLGIDTASLEEIAKQYLDDIRVAFDTTSNPSSSKAAVDRLLERTKLVVEKFRDLQIEVWHMENAKCSDEEAKRYEGTAYCSCTAGPSEVSELKASFLTDQDKDNLKQAGLETCGVVRVAAKMRRMAFLELTQRIAPGTISLRAAKATDGDLLTIRVDAVGADGNEVGIPAVFEIDIKKYGTKIQWSPSLLFVRRLGVTDAEASPPTGSTAAPINRVNFAPSPGMTFGIAFFKRGYSGTDKFVRALGPGAGMNVTFMNFNDPSFDLATSKFVNTNGTNVQVGAGVIGSLFDNKLQVSYGWNLNVEHRRTYLGVGFGFIEVGKEVAKYISK
jgi:hypothetical protein